MIKLTWSWAARSVITPESNDPMIEKLKRLKGQMLNDDQVRTERKRMCERSPKPFQIWHIQQDDRREKLLRRRPRHQWRTRAPADRRNWRQMWQQPKLE
jgi:hypothetical protein